MLIITIEPKTTDQGEVHLVSLKQLVDGTASIPLAKFSTQSAAKDYGASVEMVLGALGACKTDNQVYRITYALAKALESFASCG